MGGLTKAFAQSVAYMNISVAEPADVESSN
jgi:hypothetical protein